VEAFGRHYSAGENVINRFVAINVGNGDAFFLQREGFSVLVDGGKSRDLPDRLVKAGIDNPLLVVCTHNDSDHTNGLYDYFEAGGTANELWMPATWLEVVHRMSEERRDDIESLFDDSEDAVLDELDRKEGEFIHSDPVEDFLTDAVQIPSFRRYAPIYVRRFLGGHRGVFAITPHNKLLRAAGNIWNVAAAAARRGVRLVWFDPEVTPKASPSSPICVLNATRVSEIRRSRATLKQVLNLTMVNRMSLVLYSPPDPNAPGVLFCADSDFHNIHTPPTDPGMIITAPHYGSNDEGNRRVYTKLNTVGASHAPQGWSWVRSDQDNDHRPSGSYLQQTHRYCTQCRGRSLEQKPQDIEFVASGRQWQTIARACNCVAKVP
jgi:hypothetical protein